MSKSYKGVISKVTVEDAICDGLSDLRELRDECQESADNMSDGHPKKDAFEEAVTALDSADEEPDLEGVPEGLLKTEIEVSQVRPVAKRRWPARWARRDNACAMLRAAVEALTDAEDDHSEVADQLENIADECDGAEFPGLYG